MKSLDEAIELANGTRFGLGANIYTRDLGTMVRCMREIRSGTVWFNDPLTDNDAGPFGGFKQSGLGRELGREGLEAFQETKHVHIETKIEQQGVVVPLRRGDRGPTAPRLSGMWRLLGAPLDSSASGRGEERAPEALRAAGIAEAFGARDAGDATGRLQRRAA